MVANKEQTQKANSLLVFGPPETGLNCPVISEFRNLVNQTSSKWWETNKIGDSHWCSFSLVHATWPTICVCIWTQKQDFHNCECNQWYTNVQSIRILDSCWLLSTFFSFCKQQNTSNGQTNKRK